MSAEVDARIERSERWSEEMAAVRQILLRCGLVEEIKWGKPCYTHDGGNIVILQEMKAFLALMFFQGALLDDPAGVLTEQGPNSRSARRIEIRSVEDATRLADTIEACARHAIEVEESGLRVAPPPGLTLADELREHLDRDPALATAFEALTPGRQREYDLNVSGAKHPATRRTRVERIVPKILDGKGLRE